MTTGANSNAKSELDKYLAEDTEDQEMKFDILAWWRSNACRFPILARLAQDVLAIPISTVASESAFSTSGRILDDFRTSLTPFMLESLVCAQDWLRRGTPIDIQESAEELAVIEKELIEEFEAYTLQREKLLHPLPNQVHEAQQTPALEQLLEGTAECSLLVLDRE